MKIRACAIVSLTLFLVACRADSVQLEYHYTATHLEYVLTARAHASWQIGEPGSGSYSVRFQVDEEIQPQEDGGAIVDVTMTPIEVNDEGLLPPGADERRFRLELGPNGEKLDVLELGGVPATELADDELALIGTYRPPLPLEPVGLGDTWAANEEVTLATVFQQVATTGVLEALRRNAEGNRVAHLSYRGEGPLAHVLALPQGEATVSGDTTVSIDAEFDIDRGVLVRASSTTRGTFEARVVPEGEEAPQTGALELELRLDISEVGAN